MTRPRTDKEIRKDRRINVRFTEAEFVCISENAAVAGMSVSSYLREMALRGKTDVHYHLSPHIDDLKPLLSEIGKVGSNLNQIARFLNSGGAMADGILADIRYITFELFEWRDRLSAYWGDAHGDSEAHRDENGGLWEGDSLPSVPA